MNDTESVGAQYLANINREEVEHSPIIQEKNKIRYNINHRLAYYQTAESQSDLISRTDNAMYAAKQKGKNLVITAEN